MKHETAQGLISRLNPRISSTEPRVQGAQGGISASEVAMAMSGCSLLDEWIARLSFACQDEYRKPIKAWLINLSPFKIEYKQKVILADIVMEEVAPDRLCKTCKGRKVIIDTDCEDCHGKGWIRQTDKRRWESLGVSKTTYYRTWKDRINDMCRTYQEHESVAVDMVRKHLMTGL